MYTFIMVVKGFDINKVVLGKQIYLNSPKTDTFSQKIDVVFCTDEGYCRHMATTMASILINTDPSAYIRFHVFNTDITNYTKSLINKIKDLRECEISFYDVSDYDVSMFPVRSWVNRVTYFCLLCDAVLPEDVSRAIYLDCDLIVEEDLTKLWNFDIGNNYFAAAEDEDSTINQKRLLMRQGFYVNTGVMLFNLKKTRYFDLFQKCKDYFSKYPDRVRVQAQDLLNIVLDGKCYKLPLSWNCTSAFYLRTRWSMNCPQEDRWNAVYNPAIIHYTYVPKPWKEKCEHPLKNEYFKYLAFTPFAASKKSFLSAINVFYS